MTFDVWLDIRLVLEGVTPHQALKTLVETEVKTIHVGLDLDGGRLVRQVLVGVALQVDVVEAVVPQGTHLELLLLCLDHGHADGRQGVVGAGVGRPAMPVIAGVTPGGGAPSQPRQGLLSRELMS